MPILGGFESHGMDPDNVPRLIVAVGVTLVTTGVELDFHRHRKAQLLLTMRGVLTCEAENGLWIVPPQRAIWVPGGTMHSIKASGSIEGYMVFVEPALAPEFSAGCCTVLVTPLLRELLVRAAGFPVLYPQGGVESHLETLLLDEIAAASIEKLHLPMPRDDRLRRLFGMMMADPSDRGTMAGWASRVGLSERTLGRVFVQETGMSFGRWRQQLQIMLALERMAKGASVQQVALDLGYESAGSFVTMFRKALGTSPARYMTAQQETTPTSVKEQATS